MNTFWTMLGYAPEDEATANFKASVATGVNPQHLTQNIPNSLREQLNRGDGAAGGGGSALLRGGGGASSGLLQHHRFLNLKIVIRGARGTGKTALLHRLQGKQIPPRYDASTAISNATISWKPNRAGERHLSSGGSPMSLGSGSSSSATSSGTSGSMGASTTASTTATQEEIVKVEVWDVVDRGTPSRVTGSTTAKSLPRDAPDLAHLPTELPPLDATTVDVYHQTHGVIFMVDVTTESSLEYVLVEAQKVPRHICILIAANFCDQEDARVLSLQTIQERCALCLNRAVTPFVMSLTRGKAGMTIDNSTEGGDDAAGGTSAPVCYIETSMTTNYGLRPLHMYLNIPYNFMRIQLLEERLAREYRQLGIHASELREIVSRQNHKDWNQHRANSQMTSASASGRSHHTGEMRDASLLSSSSSSSTLRQSEQQFSARTTSDPLHSENTPSAVPSPSPFSMVADSDRPEAYNEFFTSKEGEETGSREEATASTTAIAATNELEGAKSSEKEAEDEEETFSSRRKKRSAGEGKVSTPTMIRPSEMPSALAAKEREKAMFPRGKQEFN